MHRRWLKSRSSQQSQILPDSIGLVIHNARLAPTLPQFRSAFGCLRHPGIFDTDVEFIHLLALPLLIRRPAFVSPGKLSRRPNVG